MSIESCICSDGIQSVPNDNCAAVDYGNRFVAVLVQKPEGVPFDAGAGNDLNIPADVNAKIALAGTDPDRIAVIPRVNIKFPPVAAATLAAAESASGKIEAIEFEFQGNGDLHYISKETFTIIENYTFCYGQLRIWFLSNTGWWFGNQDQIEADGQNGFEFMTVIHETPAFEGAGTKGARIPIHFNAIDKCWMKPILQNKTYLRLTETGIAL